MKLLTVKAIRTSYIQATCNELISLLGRQECRDGKAEDIRGRGWRSLTSFSLVYLLPGLSHGSLKSYVNILTTDHLCHWS